MKEKLSHLEDWRGILSLFVCISHCFQILAPKKLWNYAWMNLWGNLAHFSVILFFFISGIVIFYSLSNRFKKQDTFLSYLKARLTRIFPPFIISIIILFILRFLVFRLNLETIKSNYDFSNLDLLSSSFMVQLSLGKVNSPLWSLILEWWFYFIGYFIALGIYTKKIRIKIISILSFFGIYSFLLSINSNTTIYLIIWMLGGLFFFLFNHIYRKKISVGLGIVLTFYLLFVENIFFQEAKLSDQLFNQILTVIAFACLWSYIPKIKFLNILAKSSYSLYILHYPLFLFILGLNNKYAGDIHVVFLSSLIFIIIFAHYFGRIFENKLIFNILNRTSKKD